MHLKYKKVLVTEKKVLNNSTTFHFYGKKTIIISDLKQLFKNIIINKPGLSPVNAITLQFSEKP